MKWLGLPRRWLRHVSRQRNWLSEFAADLTPRVALGMLGMSIGSVFKWLLGRGLRTAPDAEEQPGVALFLHGKGSFLFDVVAVSRYQEALREIVTAKTLERQRLDCIAKLLLDVGDLGDRTVVAVEIDGWLVGYLPRYVATQYCEWLQFWRLSGANVSCRGMIINWNGGVGEGARYNVKLDIEIPFKMTTIWA